MNAILDKANMRGAVRERAAELFEGRLNEDYRRTDRMFAGLMGAQFLAGIAIALWISPRAWAGDAGGLHTHVQTAVALGGLISGFPILLALTKSGAPLTRHVIGMGQMLMSALLIHLTGGRIETHFHVFGSLAFLAFYRDWRVLVTATATVAADHFLRGYFWPRSIFGEISAPMWRALEHTSWVLFEVFFLFFAVKSKRAQLEESVTREAELEAVNESIESTVLRRTAELRESEGRLRRFVEGSGLGYWDWNVTTGNVNYSGRWGEMLGYQSADLEQSFATWERLVHPDDKDHVLSALQDHVAGRTSVFKGEHRMLEAAGTWRWVETRGIVLTRDADGRPTRVAGSHSDIHETKCAEESLRLREAELSQFKALLDQTHDCVFMFRPGDLRFIYFNRGALEQVGYSETELLAMTPIDIQPYFDRPMFNRLVASLIDGTKNVLRFDTVHRQKSGRDVPVEIALQFVRESGQEPRFIAVVRDITERRQSEAKLQAFTENLERTVSERTGELRLSEREFRSTFEGAAVGIVHVNVDGTFHRVNPRMCEISGRSEAELIGTQFGLLAHVDDLAAELEGVGRLMSGETKTFTMEKRLIHKDGSLVWISLTASAVYNDDGSIAYLIGFVKDVSDRIRAAEALADSERFAQGSLDALSAHVAVLDSEGIIVATNQSWREFSRDAEAGVNRLGVGDNYLSGCHTASGANSEGIAEIAHGIREVLTGTAVQFSREYSYHGAGAEFSFMCRVTRFEGEGPVRIVVAYEDITDLKQAEGALLAQQELNRLTLENLAEGVVACDESGRLFLFNKTSREWHGTDPRDIPSEEWASHYELFEADGVTPLVTERIPLIRAFNGEAVEGVEMSIVRKGGAPRVVLASGAAIVDGTGRKRGAVVVMRDVTERRQAEEDLRRSLREKEVMLKEIHHRVKNNLQVISSILDLQLDTVTDPLMRLTLKESINRVRSMAMIHEGLYQGTTLSRIEFANYTERLANVLLISYSPRSDVHLVVEAEPVQLNIETAVPCGLILNELISNALKHAFKSDKPGRVLVKVGPTETGGVRLSVHDSGPGMPAGFELKKQSTLGLQLVHALTHQIKGTMTATNDNGALFALEFKELNYKERN